MGVRGFAHGPQTTPQTASRRLPAGGRRHHLGVGPIGSVLRLQGLVGNRTSQRLVQARRQADAVPSTLPVGGPDDVHEREADLMTVQALHPAAHAAVGVDRAGRHERGAGPETAAPQSVHEVLRSPGRPLDPATRHFMGSRFGRDFHDVRVHADDRAAASAHAVHARAYTVGSHVVFSANQYAPHTVPGRRLLAHELAHVAQQDRLPGRRLQREATRPRAATGTSVAKDVETRTKGVKGKGVTAGSLARTEWESLFKRHFTEPDTVEDEVESSHSRYFYSLLYGWIDAQHFFAHIQFAEDEGPAKATEKGLSIERKQALVRRQIEPDKSVDPAGYWLLFDKPALVTPSDVEHYRDTLMIAFLLAKDMLLSKQERALTKGFSDTQFAKLLLDSAMSAWSAEDLVSNQLGVQFFRLHGAYVNAGKDAPEIRRRFLERLKDFFAAIRVVENAKRVKRLARKLPGKERWHSRKMKEATAKKRFPELFDFGASTHRLRIAIYDREERAEKGREYVAAGAPSLPGLHVAPFGSKFALYTGTMSHIEAVIFKSLVSRTIKTRALIEEAP